MAESLPEADFGKQGFDLGGSKPRLIVLVLFFAGLFVLALGAGLFFFKNQGSSGEIEILSAHSNDPINQSEIVVHVDGAVANPGVYDVPTGSRVTDVIGAAGGLTDDADQTKINLAAKVADGSKVYIPKLGEALSASTFQGDSLKGGSQTNLVNINTASEAELDTLPGIGPVTAQKIIVSRPYSSLEEL